MTNKGFEVTLNGKLLCKAGLKSNHVVSCILMSALRNGEKQQTLSLDVGGLNSNDNQHIKWFKTELLKENDIILSK